MVLKEDPHQLTLKELIIFIKILTLKIENLFYIMEMLQILYQFHQSLKKLNQMKFII